MAGIDFFAKAELVSRINAVASFVQSRSFTGDRGSAAAAIAQAVVYVNRPDADPGTATSMVVALEALTGQRVGGGKVPKPKAPKFSPEATVPASWKAPTATTIAMRAPGDWFGDLSPLGKAGIVVGGAVALWLAWRAVK